VAEIKKLNQLQTDGELHARRVIKVPSRGILINLEPIPSASKDAEETGSASASITFSVSEEYDDENNPLESGVGLAYLNSKDSMLTELKAKVDHVAANSPILNGHEDPDDQGLFSPIRKGTYSTHLTNFISYSSCWTDHQI